MKIQSKLLVLAAVPLMSLSFAWATVPARLAKMSDEWLRSEEGRRVADHVLTWQRPHGDWPKNRDTASEPWTPNMGKFRGTFDNGATTGELRFLARVCGVTEDAQYRGAFQKGVDHILQAQYPTGGWPQYYPPGDGYARYITFNDHTMVRVLELLRDVAESPDYAFVEKPDRMAARKAFARGIECILASQIIVDGQRTVWCAQHDEVDLRPRPARSYELESLSGSESAGILKLLMSLDQPGAEVRRAIRAGVAWFESSRLTGIRLARSNNGDRVVVNDASAPPLWARFYDIETNRPFFCGRDGVKKRHLSEIEEERRKGYAWYGRWGEEVAAAHEVWLRK